MCTFLPPGGVPPGGPKVHPRGPPSGDPLCNYQIYIYSPPKRAQNGAPEGGPGGSPGGPPGGPRRPGPGREISARARGGGPRGGPPGGGPRLGSQMVPRVMVPMGRLITDPTGDAFRKLHAMHRSCPRQQRDSREGPRAVTHLLGVHGDFTPSKCVDVAQRVDTSCGVVPGVGLSSSASHGGPSPCSAISAISVT